MDEDGYGMSAIWQRDENAGARIRPLVLGITAPSRCAGSCQGPGRSTLCFLGWSAPEHGSHRLVAHTEVDGERA